MSNVTPKFLAVEEDEIESLPMVMCDVKGTINIQNGTGTPSYYC